MKLLGLSYKDIVSESERLARVSNNPDLRIGKSTLGNIIGGSIRQPGAAKLDSLRMILNLSRTEVEAAIGLQTDGRFADQLAIIRPRTHDLPLDVALPRFFLVSPAESIPATKQPSLRLYSQKFFRAVVIGLLALNTSKLNRTLGEGILRGTKRKLPTADVAMYREIPLARNPFQHWSRKWKRQVTLSNH
jgi:hypothetical protein